MCVSVCVCFLGGRGGGGGEPYQKVLPDDPQNTTSAPYPIKNEPSLSYCLTGTANPQQISTTSTLC